MTFTDASTPAEHESLLARGLVGRHVRLYHTSPEFHAAVNRLARMLPLWVDGLARVADDARATREEAQRRMCAGEQWPPAHAG